LERLRLRRFITAPIPHIRTVPRASHTKMHRTKPLCRAPDLRPETRVPPGYGEALDLPAAAPWTIEPKPPLTPHPPMPAQLWQIGHQGCSRTAPSSQNNDRAAARQQHGRLCPQLLVCLETHRRTAMVEPTPHQRDGAAAREHGPTDQTVRLP